MPLSQFTRLLKALSTALYVDFLTGVMTGFFILFFISCTDVRFSIYCNIRMPQVHLQRPKVQITWAQNWKLNLTVMILIQIAEWAQGLPTKAEIWSVPRLCQTVLISLAQSELATCKWMIGVNGQRSNSNAQNDKWECSYMELKKES